VIDKNGKERRLHERRGLKNRVFIAIRPDFDRIGWLTDISKGGISFEYVAIENYSPITEKIQVDIFSSPKIFDLSNLPCKLVYDAPIHKGEGFMAAIETRRCGLVFEAMTQQQAFQLDAAMRHCA
jgi:hypothetical protein